MAARGGEVTSEASRHPTASGDVPHPTVSGDVEVGQYLEIAEAEAMAGELQSMAAWLGLSDVTVGTRGDLVGELRRALA